MSLESYYLDVGMNRDKSNKASSLHNFVRFTHLVFEIDNNICFYFRKVDNWRIDDFELCMETRF